MVTDGKATNRFRLTAWEMKVLQAHLRDSADSTDRSDAEARGSGTARIRALTAGDTLSLVLTCS